MLINIELSDNLTQERQVKIVTNNNRHVITWRLLFYMNWALLVAYIFTIINSERLFRKCCCSVHATLPSQSFNKRSSPYPMAL